MAERVSVRLLLLLLPMYKSWFRFKLNKLKSSSSRGGGAFFFLFFFGPPLRGEEKRREEEKSSFLSFFVSPFFAFSFSFASAESQQREKTKGGQNAQETPTRLFLVRTTPDQTEY